MPVTRLTLFAFLTHQLAHSPFWCERLALVPPAAADSPAPLGKDDRLWGEMRAQLNALLAQEDTFQAFLAYLVDAKRARSVESPAFHPPEPPPPTVAPLTAPAPSLQG
jgi:hypothetical protein